MPINKPSVGPSSKGSSAKAPMATVGSEPPKATRVRGMRNAGKLARLPDMPNEIFFMVAGYLMPLDMLNLMRSSKEMRSILSSKKMSKHAWVAARRNVEPPLPDCPDFVSEIQYAHFMFERRFCEACGVTRQLPLFEIPLRLCGTCMDKRVATGSKLMKRHNVPEQQAKLLILIAPLSFSPAYHEEYLQASVKQALSYSFYEPDFVAVVTRFRQCMADGAPGTAAWTEYTTALKSNVRAKVNFAFALLRWEEVVQTEKTEKNKALRVARESDVEARLVELGFELEDFPRDSRRWNHLVKQPRGLSERGWESLLPKLLALAEEWRERKRAGQLEVERNARHAQLTAYREALIGPLTSYPWIYQADSVPTMKGLYAIARDSEVTQGRFDAATPAILAELEQIRQGIRRDLVDMLMYAGAVPTGSGTNGKGKEVSKVWTDSEAHTLLDTPVALFVCNASPITRKAIATDCRHAYSYAGLMEHWLHEHDCESWDPTKVCVAWDETQLVNIARLLAALGLPLDATTMSAMEERARSGRAKCSCGIDCTREAGRKRPQLMLSRIAEHILDPDIHPPTSPVPILTFKPFPRKR